MTKHAHHYSPTFYDSTMDDCDVRVRARRKEAMQHASRATPSPNEADGGQRLIDNRLAKNEFQCVGRQTWCKNRARRGRATRGGRVCARAVCRARERGDGHAMLSSEAPGRTRGPRFGALSPLIASAAFLRSVQRARLPSNASARLCTASSSPMRSALDSKV